MQRKKLKNNEDRKQEQAKTPALSRQQLYCQWLQIQIDTHSESARKHLENMVGLPLTHLSHRLEAVGDDLVVDMANLEIFTQALHLASKPWKELGQTLASNIKPSRSSSTSPLTNFINKERKNAWLDVYQHWLQFSSAEDDPIIFGDLTPKVFRT